MRPQLESGQDIGRDIVVLTDWMAGRWVAEGFAQKFNRDNMPNANNLISRLQGVAFDPERDQTLPWQSGYAGLGFNSKTLKELTGGEQMDASAVLEYFAPLQTWLQEQNQGQTCGWDAAKG